MTPVGEEHRFATIDLVEHRFEQRLSLSHASGAVAHPLERVELGGDIDELLVGIVHVAGSEVGQRRKTDVYLEHPRRPGQDDRAGGILGFDLAPRREAPQLESDLSRRQLLDDGAWFSGLSLGT